MKNGLRTKVYGVSFLNEDGSSRQEYIRKYCRRGQKLLLLPEPENEHDPNAVGVWLITGGEPLQIGYLDKRLASELERGQNYHAVVEQVTGGTADKPTHGVNIQIFESLSTADKLQQTGKSISDIGKTITALAILIPMLICMVSCLINMLKN